MTTQPRLSDSREHLQASKRCAVGVGLIVGLTGLFVPRSEPLVLLTAVGLALAGVVILEAIAVCSRSESTRATRGFRSLQFVETAFAVCLLGGAVLWFGEHSTARYTSPDALTMLAVGMMAVSFVRTTVALRLPNAETPNRAREP